jgi:hypothetical protein
MTRKVPQMCETGSDSRILAGKLLGKKDNLEDREQDGGT